MANELNMPNQFTVKNTASIAADTEKVIMDSGIFNDINDTSTNPFPLQINHSVPPFRFLEIINDSSYPLQIRINGDRRNTLIIPSGYKERYGPQSKIAYTWLSVVVIGGAANIGEIYISGRR